MSMRNRPSILEDLSVRYAWPDTDPHSLCQPLKTKAAPPICNCPPAQAGRLGGMSPVIDRDNAKVVCKCCQREIGPGCRRRHVVHLRGLLALDQKNPQNVDWADVEAAGWLL